MTEMIPIIKKAEVLTEALPYIRKFYGKTVVIKYGGNAMTSEDLKSKVITDIILMRYVGINPVIVHGGGPAINEWLDRTEKEIKFVDGLRVTDKETMEIVQMVLVGKVSKEIVGLINQNGGLAVGFSGIDGDMIKAQPKENEKGSLGYVGEIESIDTSLIEGALEKGHIPVISPVGTDGQGNSYNINADHVAGAVAGSLGASKLMLLTDIKGVLDKEGELIPSLSFEDAGRLIREEVIAGGMIPKVECCTEALLSGVGTTHIIDGRIPHALLLEIFTDKGIGTMVTKE